MTRPKFLSIQGSIAYTGLPRTTLYELLRNGRFAAVKQGRRTLVDADSLDAYLGTLPAARFRPTQPHAA